MIVEKDDLFGPTAQDYLESKDYIENRNPKDLKKNANKLKYIKKLTLS